MGYVRYDTNQNTNIGQTVRTSIRHDSLRGYFEVGSEVTIVDVDLIRGYTIRDEYGNEVSEIGWII